MVLATSQPAPSVDTIHGIQKLAVTDLCVDDEVEDVYPLDGVWYTATIIKVTDARVKIRYHAGGRRRNQNGTRGRGALLHDGDA